MAKDVILLGEVAAQGAVMRGYSFNVEGAVNAVN